MEKKTLIPMSYEYTTILSAIIPDAVRLMKTMIGLNVNVKRSKNVIRIYFDLTPEEADCIYGLSSK